jgi:hypothetical protein
MKMEPIGNKLITGEEDGSYLPNKPEKVIKVAPEITVKPGETLDILVDCKKGFSVYLPYPMFFENPDLEAKPVGGNVNNKDAKEQWWRVQIKRKTGDNNTEIRRMAYCIYSKDLDNFAVGNSPPKMTLEP